MQIIKTYNPLKFQFIVLCILSIIIIKPAFQIITSFSSEIDTIELSDNIDFEDEVLICFNPNTFDSENESEGIDFSQYVSPSYFDVYANILIPPPKG